MATATEQRETIIQSVFSRRNAAGNLEETYVSHVKIWEEAGPEGPKPRYILLSRASNDSGFLHKSKLNTNGTFSVGKTWKLTELRGFQVLSDQIFNISLSRTYRWETENAQDQANFIEAAIDLFNSITGGNGPLRVEGFTPPSRSKQRTPQPPAASNPSFLNGRSPVKRGPTPTRQYDQDGDRSLNPRSQSRNGFISRPSSPAESQYTAQTSSSAQARSSPASYTRTRSTSSASQPSTSTNRPLRARPPSNASNQLPQSAAQVNLRPDLPHSSSGASTSSRTQAYTTSRPSSPTPSTTSTQSARARRPAQPTNANRTPAPPENLPRRDFNARISFFDPSNQALLDRLISGDGNDGEEEESSQATMTSVEEMLEGYEWASDDIIGRRSARGAADLIEARLLDELTALEKANVHSFLETDDRLAIVLRIMDDALAELDNMDSFVSSYKIHLNNVGDDISYIQSQNRGLQVQTQNQTALLAEIENLLQIVQVDKEALITLTQESLEKSNSIQRLEEAAAELYKALQAGRDTEMAASMERLSEYKTHNSQFCKRIFDFLSIMFTAQGKLMLGDNNGVAKGKGSRLVAVPHRDVEQYLGRYSGLMLYLKEMDEGVYAKLCGTYFSAASELHSTQIRALLSAHLELVKAATEEEEQGQTFSPNPASNANRGNAAIRRAGTLMRSPTEARSKNKENSDEMRASQVFGLLLEQIAPLVYRENDFITDFLQINDAALTYADYMGLDNYFRRQASRSSGLSQTTMKLARGSLDLIFGFLPPEVKTWIDSALEKDNIQTVGMLATIERFLTEADEKGNQFLQNVLEKQHTRLKTLFERHVSEQVKNVEQTKITSKKRKGVAHFIKQFPVYVGRIEGQLIAADDLEVREVVNNAYEKLVQSMFDCLKQMAKLDGEGEDKGQINYHVVLIENMHYFVAEISQLESSSVKTFVRKAEALYDENLAAYVKLMLRRPFSKIIDYFEGVERLLKTTAPTEVSTNSSYDKSALKKVVKEYSAKDMKKIIESLGKRVEKHFSEASEKTTEGSGTIVPGTVTVGVWKAFEEELLRITELFSKLISQCYPDGGVALEYSATDVEVAFKKQRQ